MGGQKGKGTFSHWLDRRAMEGFWQAEPAAHHQKATGPLAGHAAGVFEATLTAFTGRQAALEVAFPPWCGPSAVPWEALALEAAQVALTPQGQAGKGLGPRWRRRPEDSSFVSRCRGGPEGSGLISAW